MLGTTVMREEAVEAALRLELRPRGEEGIWVLAVGGRATYRQAPELRDALLDAAGRPGASHLVVDLAAVDKMDTAAMAVLVECLVATRGGDPEIFFCSPSDSVRKIFHLAGLDDALKRCYACQDDIERKMTEERAA